MSKKIFIIATISLSFCSAVKAYPWNDIFIDKYDRLYAMTGFGAHRLEGNEWKFFSDSCGDAILDSDLTGWGCYIKKNSFSKLKLRVEEKYKEDDFISKSKYKTYYVLLKKEKEIVLLYNDSPKFFYYLSDINLSYLKSLNEIKPDVIESGYAYAFRIEDENKGSKIKMYRSKKEGDGWDEFIIDKKNKYLNQNIYLTNSKGKIYFSVTEMNNSSFTYTYVSKDYGNTWKKLIIFDEIRNKEESLSTLKKGDIFFYIKKYLGNDNRYHTRLYYLNDIENNNFRIKKEMNYLNLNNCCAFGDDNFTINSKGIMYIINDYGVCESKDKGITWESLHFPRKFISKRAQKFLEDKKIPDSSVICNLPPLPRGGGVQF